MSSQKDFNQSTTPGTSSTQVYLDQKQLSHTMKTSAIIVTAAVGPVGIMCIASGFLESCSQIGFTNLEGDPGRSIMLQAYCKVQGGNDHWTQLDLNTCFG
ncbi:hypothetical protein INS49_005022 [Diaporthe citri]|uniref:uncharacterized protein n=1 Tax=Diaporthe citri TaxID=83186 RepID=UPI001C80E405|nr:uncharacterized protein INS49_005022 [Diaporthe citri]KAG6354051.1 hypothetical protein INS49_005022 [Diaporthe citri]